jgi:hypothetical protein
MLFTYCLFNNYEVLWIYLVVYLIKFEKRNACFIFKIFYYLIVYKQKMTLLLIILVTLFIYILNLYLIFRHNIWLIFFWILSFERISYKLIILIYILNNFNIDILKKIIKKIFLIIFNIIILLFYPF